MSQDPLAPLNPSTTSGTDLATKLVDFEQSLLTMHSGTAVPSYVQAGTFWLDTTTNPYVIKFYDGVSSIPFWQVNTSTHRKLSPAAETTIASSTTTDVLGSTSEYITISGTATITSLGTGALQFKFCRASGAFTLTHNATSLILPTGANITAASGDTFIVASDSSSNARVFGYQKQSGQALTTPSGDVPSGSVVLFMQASAPTGWTQVTTYTDRALRLVSSTGAGTGGSLNFSTVFGYTATLGHAITQAELPNVSFTGTTSTDGAHTHTINNATHVMRNTSSGLSRGTGSNSLTQDNLDMDTQGSHSHTVSVASGGTDTTHAHSIDMRVRYIDIIACSKD
jgi:hypothetical protein